MIYVIHVSIFNILSPSYLKKMRRVCWNETRRCFFTKVWYGYWRSKMNVSPWISPNVSVLPEIEYRTI